MTLQKGWLDKQFSKVAEEISEWPDWMRREAGFQTDRPDTETNENSNVQCRTTTDPDHKDRPES